MKIPISRNHDPTTDEYSEIHQLWKQMARQISVEYGIYVEVGLTNEPHRYPNGTTYLVPVRIFFKALDKEFESLRVLKKHLDNPVFW
jgi:hypothetical protein